MRKVLKSTATTITKNVNGREKECVRLYFQYNKEGKTYEEGDIRIYRRLDEGYVFDWDEMEYFDVMMPNAEDLIFEGRLPERGSFCEYIDENVDVGNVYVYWIVKGDSSPAGPLAVKVRDSRIWWRYDKILAEIESLRHDFPCIEVKEEGRSVLGKPLYSLTAGNPEKRVALVGAVHAGESGPEILLTALRKMLTDSPSLLERVGLAVMPVVSADNREKMAAGHPPYIRKNAAGVDLNRNFDALWETHDESYGLSSFDPESPTYHGRCPNSEPEVGAVISFMSRTSPVAVFSYHHLCSVTSDRAFIAHETVGDEDFTEISNTLSKVYSDAFRAALGEKQNPVTECVPGCSVGSLPSWCYKHGKIPCFDMEMSDTTPTLHGATRDKTTPEMLDSAIDAHTLGIRSVLDFFAKQG